MEVVPVARRSRSRVPLFQVLLSLPVGIWSDLIFPFLPFHDVLAVTVAGKGVYMKFLSQRYTALKNRREMTEYWVRLLTGQNQTQKIGEFIHSIWATQAPGFTHLYQRLALSVWECPLLFFFRKLWGTSLARVQPRRLIGGDGHSWAIDVIHTFKMPFGGTTLDELRDNGVDIVEYARTLDSARQIIEDEINDVLRDLIDGYQGAQSLTWMKWVGKVRDITWDPEDALRDLNKRTAYFRVGYCFKKKLVQQRIPLGSTVWTPMMDNCYILVQLNQRMLRLLTEYFLYFSPEAEVKDLVAHPQLSTGPAFPFCHICWHSDAHLPDKEFGASGVTVAWAHEPSEGYITRVKTGCAIYHYQGVDDRGLIQLNRLILNEEGKHTRTCVSQTNGCSQPLLGHCQHGTCHLHNMDDLLPRLMGIEDPIVANTGIARRILELTQEPAPGTAV